MKAVLLNLGMICGLLVGCVSDSNQQPIPKSPEGSPPVFGAEAPPRPEVFQRKIEEKERELERVRRAANAGRTIEELEKEIEDRKARIQFLKDEIDALISQRKAAEIYYRQKGIIK